MNAKISLNAFRDALPTPDPLRAAYALKDKLAEANSNEAVQYLAAIVCLKSSLTRWEDFLIERSKTGKLYSDEGEICDQIWHDFERLAIEEPAPIDDEDDQDLFGNALDSRAARITSYQFDQGKSE